MSQKSLTYDQRARLPKCIACVTARPENNGVLGTLLGTVASAATLSDLFCVPADTYITVSGATMRITTGGTRAGTGTEPNWGLATSLAGTGANVLIGTLAFGTRADNTWGNFSVTETDLAAGDVLRLTSIAGTDTDGSQIAGGIYVEYRYDPA